MLEAREAEKIQKYEHAVQVFHPIALTLGGGTITGRTQTVFEHWRYELGNARYGWLSFDVALSLLKAKSRFFVL